jgi:P-type conjugative transfer protein TrbJ
MVTKRNLLILSGTAISLTPLNRAIGAGIFNAAQESTQWLNFGQLTAQLLEQVAMVKNQIDQYKTMLTNLMQLPGRVMDSITQPARDLLDIVAEFSSSAIELQESVKTVGTMWQRRNSEMINLRMNPKEYIRQEMILAKSRGSKYQQQWTADINTLQNLGVRAQKFQELASEIPNVEGNVQGLQLLNTQLNLAAQELVGIHSVLRKNSINEGQDRMDREQAKVIEAERRQAQLDAQTRVTERDKGLKLHFKAPWEL